MAPQSHRHRPTLKQTNKAFKSKHASKGALKAAAKGKTTSVGTSGSNSQRVLEAGSKKARLHQQAQKRDLKQRASRENAKFFSTSSGGGHVPRVISLVPLLPSLSCRRFVSDLLPSFGLSDAESADVMAKFNNFSSILIPAPRFKTTILLNVLPPLELYPTLDSALVSDTVILLLSSVDEVQPGGEAILRCLQGQAGSVNMVSCVQAPETKPVTPATRSLIHKSLLSFSRYFFPDVSKIYSADTANESLILARTLCETPPTSIYHPEGRSWLAAEGENAVSWKASSPDDDTLEQTGNLHVTGTVRGGRLSANRLVHLPGFGDYQVAEIRRAQQPAVQSSHSNDVLSSLAVLDIPNEQADDLTANNIPDLLANEQTWPTEEDMLSAPAAQNPSQAPRRVKRVPKGTSAYQAAWIFDDDDDDAEDDDNEAMSDSGDNMMEDAAGHDIVDRSDDEEEEETEVIELDERAPRHQDMAPEQEEMEYEAYLRERERAQQEDMTYPDEIDTPRHVDARTRFQRYRGLRSFRTSPWDPYENLPMEYGEIFQFENFAATQKRVEQEARDDGVEVGTKVELVIRDVPRQFMLNRHASTPLSVHGLLRHEHKQTVLHFAIQRNTEYTDPVKAKDSLVLCVGPRRLVIRPLLSQHVRGGGKGVNNVHKSEKFLRPGVATVATTFGPVCFGKQPCLLLREPETGGAVPDLVAMGSFLSSDPTRIVAKRIVLTGHPFKVHKKTATIRYMFFNREDVDYFKSVELHTKYGRTGHIREALGTHGYFKAHFDGPIQQMDTICMNLYKRQFPKWSEHFTSPAVSDVPHSPDNGNGMDIE